MFNPEVIRSRRRLYFVCPPDADCLQGAPWKDEEFDAFIVVLEDREISDNERRAIAALVLRNSDWIETCGFRAEELHDEIDNVSVSVGRQASVGDGSPMTAWHERLRSMEDLVEYLRVGGLGSSDSKLVILVARDEQVGPFLSQLARELGADTVSE